MGQVVLNLVDYPISKHSAANPVFRSYPLQKRDRQEVTGSIRLAIAFETAAEGHTSSPASFPKEAEVSLPPGWTIGKDGFGRKLYINTVYGDTDIGNRMFMPTGPIE